VVLLVAGNAPCAGFIRDFPYGFMPTTSVELFRDFLLSPEVCKPVFESAPVFSLAQRVFGCLFGLPCPFSPGCKDTASVVVTWFPPTADGMAYIPAGSFTIIKS